MVYNEETNRLELGEGEVVGKHIETHRDIGDEDEEREEYENTAIDLENEEADLSNLASKLYSCFDETCRTEALKRTR